MYIYSVKNKMLTVNSGSHEDNNVDIIDNVMPPCCVQYTTLSCTRHIITRQRDLILLIEYFDTSYFCAYDYIDNKQRYLA